MSVLDITPAKSGLPLLQDFCQLSERVWRVMGQNPGAFTLQGLGARKILIDCNHGQPNYVQLLIRSLATLGAYITDIYITHSHKDHIGGVGNVLESEITKDIDVKVHKYPSPPGKPSSEFVGTFPEYLNVIELTDNQIIEVDSDTHLRVLHTPGHIKDHCAFYLQEENYMFTGDCVLGHGQTAFEDLSEFISSLYRILSFRPTKLFPGHGDVVYDGIQRIKGYIAMREKKDRQILEMMETDTIWTANSLTESLNPETRNYSPGVKEFAVRLVGVHLIKLYKDGKVVMLTKDSYEARTGLLAYNPLTVLSIFDEQWTLCCNNKL